MRTFYSEYGEDRWVFENVKLPARGVYLDLGCAHPQQYSNTAFLRDRGWTGLAIDANPDYAPHWSLAGAPFYAAILADAPEVPFSFHANHATSRIEAGAPLRPAEFLEDILRRYQLEVIDYLSLDLEGAEFAVLQTFDLERHRPAVIVAEYNTGGIGEDFRVRDYLLGRGYQAMFQTVANLVYLKVSG